MTEWKSVKVPAPLMQSVEIASQGQGYESRGEIVRDALRSFLNNRIEHLIATRETFPENVEILKSLQELERGATSE